MSYDNGSAFKHVLQLLLSPVIEPFRRYLDICDDVHMRDANRNTMLHWAAAVGNAAAAYELLQHGLEVDARNVYGATPLLVAAAFCPNIGVMGPLLVQHGGSLTARVNSVNQDGVPSLLAARGLTPLWTWLSTMKSMLDDKEDEAVASHLRASPTIALPAAALVNAAAPLLCAPEEIRQLSSGRFVPAKAPSAAAPPQKVPIPRAPARQRSLQSGSSAGTPSVSTPVAPLPAARTPSTSPGTDAALLTRDTERERQAAISLIDSHECAARLRLEKEQLEAFLEVHLQRLSTWPSTLSGDGGDEGTPGWSTASHDGGAVSEEDAVYAGLVGCIHAVLGEKCGSDGRRYLLVQYVPSPQRSLSGAAAAAAVPEAWCPLGAVAADPIVAAYVDHCNRTYTLTNSVGRAAAATPSILLGDGVDGMPLDTIEREQLEAQLRLLPRRDLSSRESLSSIVPAARPVASVPPTHPPAVPERESKRESGRVDAHPAPPTGLGAAPVVTSVPASFAAMPRAPLTRSEEDVGRPSWRFARRAVEEAEQVPDGWAATAPTRAAVQPTLSERTGSKDSAAATCAVTTTTRTPVAAAAAAVAMAAAPESMLVLPIPVRNVETLRMESLLDTNAGTSAPASTTYTQGPSSNRVESTEGSASTDRRYHLSDTQRAKYNSYLRDAALQRLHRRQSQLSSSSPKA